MLWRLRARRGKSIKFPKTIGEERSKQNANAPSGGHGGDDSSSCFLKPLRRNTFNLAFSHWRDNQWILFAQRGNEKTKNKCFEGQGNVHQTPVFPAHTRKHFPLKTRHSCCGCDFLWRGNNVNFPENHRGGIIESSKDESTLSPLELWREAQPRYRVGKRKPLVVNKKVNGFSGYTCPVKVATARQLRVFGTNNVKFP